jgi:hypothetical protein
MYIIKKVISGGQTGVDQAALDAAMELGFETGGWCPPGKVNENGKIPLEYKLIESEVERSDRAPDIPRSQRTENNVRFSDATLVLIPDSSETDIGTEWTFECVRYYNKPFLVINPYQPDANKRIIEWISKAQPEIINIAGPSEKTSPGIYNQSYKLMIEILNR